MDADKVFNLVLASTPEDIARLEAVAGLSLEDAADRLFATVTAEAPELIKADSGDTLEGRLACGRWWMAQCFYSAAVTKHLRSKHPLSDQNGIELSRSRELEA